MDSVGFSQRVGITVERRGDRGERQTIPWSDNQWMRRGRFALVHCDADGTPLREFALPNMITTVGLDYGNGVAFSGSGVTTQINTWYIGLISNTSYTAVAIGDTMASHSGWTEYKGYAAANRVAWNEGVSSGGVIGTVTTSDFTIGATDGLGATLNGIFLTSVQAHTPGNTGTLWSTALFSPLAQAFNLNDIVKVTYTLTTTGS